MEDKYRKQYFKETGNFWLSVITYKPTITYVEWLEQQLTLAAVKYQREQLLAYEEWINEYKTLEEREKQVDKYLGK